MRLYARQGKETIIQKKTSILFLSLPFVYFISLCNKKNNPDSSTYTRSTNLYCYRGMYTNSQLLYSWPHSMDFPSQFSLFSQALWVLPSNRWIKVGFGEFHLQYSLCKYMYQTSNLRLMNFENQSYSKFLINRYFNTYLYI